MRRDILYRWLERQPVEEIAKVYSISPRSVKKILRDPDVLEERDRITKLMTQHMSTRMELMVPEAIELVRDTLRGANNDELRLKAAKEILDRAASFQKESGDSTSKDLGAAILRELGKVAATKLAQHAPEVDVTPASETTDAA